MDIADLQRRARELTLGPVFSPREHDVETPSILLNKLPDLQDMLKVVGLSGKEVIELRQAANGNGGLFVCLCICACLRYRDAAKTPYFAMTDAQTLYAQDADLSNELGKTVMSVLGLTASGQVSSQAVSAAKNDSEASQSDATGSPSLPPSEAVPSPNLSPDLISPNTSNG